MYSCHMSDYSYTIVRYQGRLIRIPKGSFETEERAIDRTWHFAKTWNGQSESIQQTQMDTFKWANEKYFGMKYVVDEGHRSETVGS